MPNIISELFQISDNAPFWAYLSAGGSLDAIDSCPPSTARTTKAALCHTLRERLSLTLRTGADLALATAVGRTDTIGKVAHVGETILCLYALREGGVGSDEVIGAIRKAATNLALELAKEMEAVQPQDAGDAELLKHGIALREWAHLFAEYYRDENVPSYHAELLMIRTRVTNSTLNSWHNHVGCAMIDIAVALEAIGNLALAQRCYEGVRQDLRILVDRIENPFLGPYELACGLFWLQRAYEHTLRHDPENLAVAGELAELRALRASRGDPEAISAPRFGPIAKTYLEPTPFLALILSDLQRSHSDVRERESTEAICQRYGCTSEEVEFYLSAMGSYQLRTAFAPTGLTMLYDDAHLAVFAALDYLGSNRG